MTLEVREFSKHYDGVVALDGVSALFESGAITGVVGPNGSGKSTLFDVMTGVTQRDSGVMTLDGEEVDPRRIEVLSQRGITRTYQVPRLAGSMTVLENLMVVPRDGVGEKVGRLISPWQWPRIRADERDRLSRSREMLEKLGISPMANDLAGTLSGGQKKLLALAAALMSDPPVLLLDEPTAGVNPVIIEVVQSLLVERRTEGYVTVLIEHNLSVVSTLCETVYVLDAGRLIVQGTPDEIKADPQVIRAYLGNREVGV